MKEFPDVPLVVRPLYSSSFDSTDLNENSQNTKVTNQRRTRRRSLADIENTHVTSQGATNGLREPKLSDIAYNYRSTVKIIQTKMYEPVSDHCVTIMSPRFAKRNIYDQSNIEEECAKIGYCDKNSDLPPDKPPRRNKLQKQLSKQGSLEVSKCKTMRTDNGGDNCIDIDHIHLETERNYKNKYQSTSVQTSPIVPYRLRFWPKRSSAVKCDPDENCTKTQIRCCCRTLSRWFLSQVGLTIVLTAWAALGAAAFYKTEGPRELEQSQEIHSLQDDLSIELATALRQVNMHEDVWPNTVKKYIAKHETLLLEAVSAGYGEGGGGRIWTYPGCILFAISLLTTLGFGAPVPRTPLGRGAAVLFSAFGIPLHFLLILNIGNLTAMKLHHFAFRKCKTDIPASLETNSPQPMWLKWFPLIIIVSYYFLGVILFGFVRQRTVVDSFMFPLDFTAAGGVAKTLGHTRILYGLYLEVAVMLAALVVSLLQVSATNGVIDLGLRLGLLTNT